MNIFLIRLYFLTTLFDLVRYEPTSSILPALPKQPVWRYAASVVFCLTLILHNSQIYIPTNMSCPLTVFQTRWILPNIFFDLLNFFWSFDFWVLLLFACPHTLVVFYRIWVCRISTDFSVCKLNIFNSVQFRPIFFSVSRRNRRISSSSFSLTLNAVIPFASLLTPDECVSLFFLPLPYFDFDSSQR